MRHWVSRFVGSNQIGRRIRAFLALVLGCSLAVVAETNAVQTSTSAAHSQEPGYATDRLTNPATQVDAARAGSKKVAIASGAVIHRANPNGNYSKAIPPIGSSPSPGATPPAKKSAPGPSVTAKPRLSYRNDDVYASIGFSEVDVYNPTSGDLVTTLTDSTGAQYTIGSAFDATGHFYVTDGSPDGSVGGISEYDSFGNPMPTFATGLNSPSSLAFDDSGNLYVGQVRSPYIAVFNPDGTRQSDIGPLHTELYGTDWIDLASDECTFYYTTERTDIMRYDKCTDTQLSNFNTSALPSDAFELRILPDGDVLVADSDRDLLLNSSGSVIETYSCSDLPGCQGLLFNVAVNPGGTSFWTGDNFPGTYGRSISPPVMSSRRSTPTPVTSTGSPSKANPQRRPTCPRAVRSRPSRTPTAG